ncbi:hypothetical protein FHS31_000822 [Sphingomonas vulcanisoli]|uniref:Uncharacterized protein n=1 Tax=Sphingomonas vulcanisoli TaxID=1658060 RepID=A0ABX0TUG9_9SPHN|nr:hypothetical protein [Sphingomonas vulcanisoli]NIJ07226.1 hypothetical protein [Sphingomonas vulcanisoli]
MIPWFLVSFVRFVCSFFGARVYAVSVIGGWGAASLRFHRERPADPEMEAMIADLAISQRHSAGDGQPSGWARAQRRPAIS